MLPRVLGALARLGDVQVAPAGGLLGVQECYRFRFLGVLLLALERGFRRLVLRLGLGCRFVVVVFKRVILLACFRTLAA